MKRLFFLALALTTASALLGCADTDTSHDDHNDPPAADSASHAHAEDGPHGGHLVELGNDYCAEIIPDHDSHTVTVHLLDGEDQELTEPVEATVAISVFKDGEYVDYSLAAADEPGAYTLEDDALCHALDHAEDVRARLKVTIGGEELVGRYEHEAHGEDEAHDD